MEKNWRNKLALPVLFVLVILGSIFCFLNNDKKINGVLLLTENTGDINGYYKWVEKMNKQNNIKPTVFLIKKLKMQF